MSVEKTGDWPWPRALGRETPPSLERRRVRVGDARIAYETCGAGPPLVLVHGLGSSGRCWARNIARLSRDFRVYLIDLVGFGGSGRQAFVLENAADHLVGWMDAVGLQRATFVGHSMGGYVCADLASRYPRRVARLVLVNSAALPFAPGYARHLWNSIRGLRWVSPAFLPIAVVDSLRAGPNALLGGIRQILGANLTERLSRVTAPTLLIWGEGDSMIPPETGETLARVLPNATFAPIERAGHNPMWDRPERFNELLIDFLASDAMGRASAD